MTFQVWLCWLAGVAFGGVGAFLICWGLFSDRLSGSWKKRRCRGCLYDMTSVSGLKCPECGREAKREADLAQLRRRWGMTSFGMILALGAFCLNWYAAGLALGWTNVAPSALLVRLSPIIGREAALRAVIAKGVSGFPPPIPIEDVSSWTLRATESVAISILEDRNALPSEVFAAVDALYWMREKVSRPEDIVRVLTECPPGRMMPQFPWTNALYFIIAKHEIVLDPDRISAAAQSIGMRPDDVAGGLLSNGLTKNSAKIVPDLLVRGRHNQITWPELAGVAPEIMTALLKRLREVYFAGDAIVKQRVTSFLYPNGRMMPAENADFEAMARDQIGQMRRGEDTDFLVENSFVSWQLSVPLSGLIPELADLLSSPKLYARERANDVLRRIEGSPTRSTALTKAIAGAIRDGTDEARALAIPITWRRRDIDREPIVEAIVDSVGKVTDPAALDAMYRFVFPLVVEGVPANKQAPLANSAFAEDLQRVLSETVQADGPCSVVSAMWIARLPSISPETAKVLAATMEDGSKSAAIRVAARDALLHIRDRERPNVSPSAPLIESAAPSFAR